MCRPPWPACRWWRWTALLAANTASRLLDSAGLCGGRQAQGSDLAQRGLCAPCNSTIWSELKSGAEIDRLRRNLQREHLKRLQTVLTRAPANLPPDALSLARLHATQLQSDLRAATARGGLSVETRAHLAESLGVLTEALRATMQRS